MMRKPSDHAFLEALEEKLVLVRGRVRSVARRYTTGFYLWGTGGTCKSFTVIEELERLKVDYKVHNSRMTGRGLPDSIHLLEDMERIFRDTMAQGVLRSALWGQAKDGQMERRVTWHSHGTHLEFFFTGGIIMTANRPLDDLAELKALATRVSPLRLQVTNHELAALMRHVALRGFRHGDSYLQPEACLEVAEYIIERCSGLNRNLDMRLLLSGLADRLQFEAGEMISFWKDLVWSRLMELVSLTTESRAERLRRERDIAAEIKGMARDERLNVWKEAKSVFSLMADESASAFRNAVEFTTSVSVVLTTSDDFCPRKKPVESGPKMGPASSFVPSTSRKLSSKL